MMLREDLICDLAARWLLRSVPSCAACGARCAGVSLLGAPCAAPLAPLSLSWSCTGPTRAHAWRDRVRLLVCDEPGGFAWLITRWPHWPELRLAAGGGLATLHDAQLAAEAAFAALQVV